MFNLIFNLYLKHKEENNKKMWERFWKLPKRIIGLFVCVIVCALLSFIFLFIFKDPTLYWIPFAIELLSVILLGFSSEKYFVDNSQIEFNKYANECKIMYQEIFQKCIKSDEQLYEIIDMANKKIAELQNKMEKKYEPIRKFNQVLLIPFVLIILKKFWDSSNDISILIVASLVIIILYLIVYNFMFPLISLINYDITNQINKLKCFVNDLQEVINIMVNFRHVENVELALEKPKTNDEKNLISNKKSEKNDDK